MSTGASRIHISVVSPVYRAEACLAELYRRVRDAVETITPDFELVLVDDASPDGCWRAIEELAAKDDRVRGIQLTRNFGQHHAVTAGLEAARGEWIIVMDCDLQDPPEEIPRLYAKAVRDGHLCVMARRRERKDSALKRSQSRLFYRVFGYLTDLAGFDGAVSNFSIAHRQVIADLNRMNEAVRFYPGLLFWSGYPSAFIDVAHEARFSGQTAYTFVRLVRHSLNIVLAHSTKPLMLCVLFGLTVAAVSFVAGLFYLARAVFVGSPVTGWASLMISLMFSTGTIIFTLGIQGLYVGRLFTEVKKRPLYLVRRRSFGE